MEKTKKFRTGSGARILLIASIYTIVLLLSGCSNRSNNEDTLRAQLQRCADDKTQLGEDNLQLHRENDLLRAQIHNFDTMAFIAFQDSIINDLKQKALQEVDQYRADATYQVDTMRQNMFDERDRILARLDSIENRDNMIIRGDTLQEVEAVFDEITGKPKLIFR